MWGSHSGELLDDAGEPRTTARLGLESKGADASHRPNRDGVGLELRLHWKFPWGYKLLSKWTKSTERIDKA